MKTTLAFLAWTALGVLTLQAAENGATIETPPAGWRHLADDRSGFVQPVHYPASSVNTEEATPGALIAGRIKHAHKGRPTLVVNGVPLPLATNPDGSFARPYVFGRGSNSVELRAEGRSLARRQFYDASAGRAPVKLRILLSWDTDGTDVDLHVIDPLGGHCFYGDRVVPSGGALDVDVTTGFGPEIFAHPSPPPGRYLVYVNYYGAGEEREDLTVAQVHVIIGEGTPREKRQSFSVPLRKPGELMFVHSFVYP
jgi:uncharacterized protein YfaP (DUF2135 family)